MSFVQYIRLPSDTTLTAFDTAQLHRLRNQVNGQSDPAQGDKVDAVQKGEAEVARQFEAIFIQQMLKQARQGSSLSGLFDTEHMRLYQSMADEQMAIQMSDPGIGLAQTLLARMRGGRGEGLAKPVLAGLPESASSRLPQLQSRMKVEGKEVASSISD